MQLKVGSMFKVAIGNQFMMEVSAILIEFDLRGIFGRQSILLHQQ